MTQRKFAPGFRLSGMDVAILVAGAIATVALATVDRWIGLAVGFVVGHFFLFCNVLRMSRLPEMVWAVAFALLAITAVGEVVAWPVVFAISAGLTGVLAVNEMRRPWYHGVGWQRVNPGLRAWWEVENAGAA